MPDMSQRTILVERYSPVVKQTDSNHFFSRCATRKWTVRLSSQSLRTLCSQAPSVGPNRNTQLVCLATSRQDFGTSREHVLVKKSSLVVVDSGCQRSDSDALIRAEVAATLDCSLFDLPAIFSSDNVARMSHCIVHQDGQALQVK